MKGVIYVFKNHRKINGSLFYCFEYFLYSWQFDKNIKYFISNIDEKNFQKVLHIFSERYHFGPEVLENIVRIEKKVDFYSLKLSKVLYLDVHSFQQVHFVLPCETLCYSDEPHEMERSKLKDVVYYGYYHYQPFDKKEKLKFFFDAYKEIKKGKNAMFVTSQNFMYEKAIIPSELQEKKLFYKKPNDHFSDLFEQFDTLFYVHTHRDTNNRLVPESYFYNKKVYIQYTDLQRDSIYYRDQEIREKGLVPYTLSQNDQIISDFLS